MREREIDEDQKKIGEILHPYPESGIGEIMDLILRTHYSVTFRSHHSHISSTHLIGPTCM